MDTFILKFDKVCPNCGIRNKIEHITNFKLEIVACGGCGEFLMIPEDIDIDDKEVISETINKIIEEGPDALL
jgi:hypothetical protein